MRTEFFWPLVFLSCVRFVTSDVYNDLENLNKVLNSHAQHFSDLDEIVRKTGSPLFSLPKDITDLFGGHWSSSSHALSDASSHMAGFSLVEAQTSIYAVHLVTGELSFGPSALSPGKPYRFFGFHLWPWGEVVAIATPQSPKTVDSTISEKPVAEAAVAALTSLDLDALLRNDPDYFSEDTFMFQLRKAAFLALGDVYLSDSQLASPFRAALPPCAYATTQNARGNYEMSCGLHTRSVVTAASAGEDPDKEEEEVMKTKTSNALQHGECWMQVFLRISPPTNETIPVDDSKSAKPRTSLREKSKSGSSDLVSDTPDGFVGGVSANQTRYHRLYNYLWWDPGYPYRYILQGVAWSPPCNVSIELTGVALDYSEKYVQLWRVVTADLLASILEVWAFDSCFSPAIAATSRNLSKISCAMMDHLGYVSLFYVFLLFSMTGIGEIRDAIFLGLVSKFLLYWFIEGRLHRMIWMATHNASADQFRHFFWRDMSKKVFIVFGGMLTLIIAPVLWHVVLVGMISFWIPQIIENLVYDRCYDFPKFVIVLSISRLLLPLTAVYMSTPEETSPYYIALLAAWVAFQAGVLLAQAKWGPRLLLDSYFQASEVLRYSYHRVPDEDRHFAGLAENLSDVEADVEVAAGAREVDCTICMHPVQKVPATERMITPCSHYFHPACLSRWMDIKMECPTCRMPLPHAD
eukprot:Rmarinus@m.21047